MKKFILIFLVVFLVLAAGIAVFLFYPRQDSSSVQAEEIVRSKKIVSYDPGGTFVTNLKDSKRYLKVSMIIELENKKPVASMTKENYRIRDVISYILSSYTEDEMRDESFRDNLKLEIREQLEARIAIEGIVDIYFNEFIIQ